MGCWNKTCGLSNLHIYHGTPVYVFVLEKTDKDDDRCYTTALYRPVVLPFYSEYNDYGGGENSSGVGLDVVMSSIKKTLVEKDIGENQYHDIEVKRDKFGERLFFDSVRENRLETKLSDFHHPTSIDFVMFRKDIVDNIFEDRVCELYVGRNKGTGGWDNSYISYKFSDVVADVDAFFDRLILVVNNAPEYLTNLPMKYRIRGGLRDIFKYEEQNKAALYCNVDTYRYSVLVNIGEIILDLVEANDIVKAKEVFIEFLKFSFLDSYMHSIRKIWVPGCHEGSQSAEIGDYRLLCSAINSALDAEEAEY